MSSGINLMKIITWNCCLPPWSISRSKRLPKIVSTIISHSPDIICLQEVFFKRDAVFLQKELESKGFIDFFHFKDLFIASKTKLSLKEGQKYKKQGKLFSLAILDVLYKKAFQLVECQDFTIVNTHLLSALASDIPKHQKTREKQIRRICERLGGISKKLIILGDFNFKPGTKPYNILLDAGFVDTMEDRDTKTKIKSRLDYFFVKNINNCKIKIGQIDYSASDHALLILDVS